MRNKIGLICEGGGTKTAYTCGVLEFFLEANISFPYCVGISAGAEALLPFVSKQKERLKITGIDATSDPKAIGIYPLIHERGLFGIRHVSKFIEQRAPLDYDAFIKSETKMDIGLYNMDENKVEYFSKEYFDHEEQILMQASCALFLLTRPYKFMNHKYMDAGLLDMIPIQQSIAQQNDKHIIISTKEENYRRLPASRWQLLISKIMYPKNKDIHENLKIRHLNYQKQWDLVHTLQAQKKALVLRPSADYKVTRTTQNKELLKKWYDLGYQDSKNRIEMIRKFMEEE